MFEKVRVYLKDWNAKPKRAKRVPHVAFQESAYRALLKDNGAVSLDRRGAMEKFHFNAVQQVVGLCQGGKRKKQHTEKTHAKLSLVRCCFLGFFGDFGSAKFWNPVLDDRFEKEEIYQHEAHCDGPQR